MDIHQAPVKFTQSALNELDRLVNNLDLSPDQYLRIGVKGGGCAGVSFLLGFDFIDTVKDRCLEIQGRKILISKAHLMHIVGYEIDFYRDDSSSGFVFNSPEEQEA